MRSRDHYELFRYLMEQFCLLPENMFFVENVSAWCREQGIDEPDTERPLRLISTEGEGCKLLIGEDIPETVLDDRINAMRIRSQLKGIAVDRADALNTEKKKLTFLFLNEYALTLPEMEGDELLADDWALREMDRLGFFRE